MSFRLAAAVLLLASTRAAAQLRLPDLGLPKGTPPPAAEAVPIDPDEERTNFSYGEMDSRLEKTVLGRKKRGRRAPPKTGVTPADRVDDGKIRYIVVHSACGTYEGSIEHLLKKPTAAHFIVSRQGDVTRMVRIKDIAMHVKNPAIRAESVGIETETGISRAPWFTPQDWDPEETWKMYSSLAWLIRAVAKEARVPRDEAHILGHEEVDRGMRDAHTDPGPYFYTQVYPAFAARFPGEGVTPRAFLMKLVRDDAPPALALETDGQGRRLVVTDREGLGVERARLYRVDGKKQTLLKTWTPPERGLPPASVPLELPSEPGTYSIEAADLVGNVSRARLTLEARAADASDAPDVPGGTDVRIRLL